ncbi:MAG: hypothetical protein CVU39_00920 [Chloroflexi bacterium HGW-Chloroflexi-10]|nr:MAG: hypothetical protein CVU39_00920 [Chloroflexi bacterium HGW-Chloroflexi-10]
MQILNTVLALIIAASLIMPMPFYAAPEKVDAPPPPGEPLQTLEALSGGQLEISYDAETGLASSISTTLANPIEQNLSFDDLASADGAAKAFLVNYGPLFGVNNPDEELSRMKVDTTEDKHTFVRYQQVYQGIPIMGGEIIVQTISDGGFLSANGEILPDIDLDTNPTLSAAAAQAAAIERVANDYEITEENLVVSEPELWIYNPVVLGIGGLGKTRLVWRMEVISKDDSLLIDELVLVDAQTGIVHLHFNQVDSLLDLAVYNLHNTESLPGTFVCDETDLTCAAGDADAKDAQKFAADTYNYYASMFGRNSFDNAGAQMILSVHYGSNYENAYWSPSAGQFVFGDANGYVHADDVVAHEITHAVTQYEAHLFYYFQSGAVNESLSDIFGELIDQQNNHGTDTAAVKWLIGEDVTGLGAGRSMSDPTAYGYADKMSSSNYYCGTGDNGGVHRNTGIGNKAAYLMTDGGTFNGYTINAIGATKTAKIYYRVQTQLLTSASDYANLYHAVNTSCNSLVGQHGITSADCGEVNKALLAVEMNSNPTSSFCQSKVAAVCPAGKSPDYSFKDDLEDSDSGNWTFITDGGSTNYWAYPQNPNPTGADMTNSTSGVTNLYGYDVPIAADYSIAMGKNVALPANSDSYLRFNHEFLFNHAISGSTVYVKDKGYLEYSLNNGAWQDAGSLIDSGMAYNVNSSFFGFYSFDYVSTRLNLSSLKGNDIRFRFRIKTDASGDDYGWFIDDIGIYSCTDHSVFLPMLVKGYAGSNALNPPSNPYPASGASWNTSTAALSWSGSSGTNITYSVYLEAGDNSPDEIVSSNQTGTGFVTGVLTPQTTYYWQVTATDQNGKNASGPVWSFTTTASNIMTISAGGESTCALSASGGVTCWGLNDAGQLGDGTTTNQLMPVAVSGLSSGVKAISAGDYHICALTTGGGVKCWGDNQYGQLGNGTANNSSTPVNVSGLSSGVIAISAGTSHSCALTSDGGVKCWGWNEGGQLGIGTLTNSSIPATVSGLGSGVMAIASGLGHSCALNRNGEVKCWGYNEYGQLGNNSTADSLIPVSVSGLRGVSGISAANLHTCALTNSGAVYCWGLNDVGELGNGSTTNASQPVMVSGLSSGITAISAGGFQTCSLTQNAGVNCWGDNTYGQVGDGTNTHRSTPVTVSSLSSGVSVVSAGNMHTCALKTNGEMKCWGHNNAGQLGNGTLTDSTTPVDVGAEQAPNVPSSPSPATGASDQSVNVNLGWIGGDPNGDNVTYDVYFEAGDNTPDIRVSQAQSAASYEPGTLSASTTYYWQIIATDPGGKSTTGPVWSFSTINQAPNVPSNPSPATGASSLALDTNLSWSGGDPDGDAVTYDLYFEAGDNTPDVRVSTAQSGTSYDPGTLSTGTTYYWQIIATDENGKSTASVVWNFSTLNNAPYTPSNPAPASGAADQSTSVTLGWNGGDPDGDSVTYNVYLEAIDSTPDVTVSVSQTGTSYAPGKLSTGTTYYWQIVATDKNNVSTTGPIWSLTTGNQAPTQPYAPFPLENATSESADSILYWSGGDPDGDSVTYNVYFEAGDSSPDVLISPDQTATSFDPGTLAYGATYYWQISTTDQNHVTTVGPIWQFTTAATSSTALQPARIDFYGTRTCGINDSGGAMCWGSNSNGLLGDGTNNNSTVPVNVSGLTSGITSISIGMIHACALTESAGVMCWGQKLVLGNGFIGVGYQYTPIPSTSLTSGVRAIAVGDGNSCALTSSGGVKCWGSNTNGEVGNGTTSTVQSPVSVSGLTSGVIAIGEGSSHSCALTSSGGVKCWGDNTYGQLGNGSTTDSSIPTNVSGLSSGVVAISLTGNYSCALLGSGGVKCWGRNNYGQLGNGTTSDNTTPVSVTGLNSDAISVSAGSIHTCALMRDGSVKCWGRNISGQLGVGSTTDSSVPVNVSGLSGGVTTIGAGGASSCAFMTSGGLKCWGDNTYGQLGDGTTINRYTPVDVNLDQAPNVPSNPSPATGASDQSVDVDLNWTGGDPNGDSVTYDVYFEAEDSSPDVLVSSDQSGTSYDPGTLNAATTYYWQIVATDQGSESTTGPVWNFSTFNQAPDLPSNPSPVSGATNQATSVTLSWTGGDLDGDNVTYDIYLEAGDNTPDNLVSSAQSTTSYNPGSLSAGFTYYWQIIATDEVGKSSTSAVWNFTTLNNAPYIPFNPSPAAGAADQATNVMLTWNGGDPDGNSVTYDVYVEADDSSPDILVSADQTGTTYNPGTLSVSTTYYWQIVATDQNNVTISGPVWYFVTAAAPALEFQPDRIGLYSWRSCASNGSGAAYCWGDNYNGILGDGTTTNSSIPVNVAGLTSGIVSISPGILHSCVLTTDGAVLCWGYRPLLDNESAALHQKTPVPSTHLTSGIVAIAVGDGHSCALTASGEVKCWGGNAEGELGNGSTIDSSIPVSVSGLTNGVTRIGAGSSHNCALTTSGGVKCWGDNAFGQLGNGSTTDSTTPVDVTGLTSDVTAISINGYHSCALLTGGSVKCWGNNNRGQLGNGITTNSSVPVQVSGLISGVTQISVGDIHTCSVLSNGSVKCWGSNYNGQLGNGTTTDSSVPVDVSGLTSGVTTIGIGGGTSCALVNSGILKCWGKNESGEIGDGTTTDRYTPVVVSGFSG